jgi:membrane-associated phospholipid phosphatase
MLTLRRLVAVVAITFSLLNVTTVARAADDISGHAVMSAIPVTAILIAYFRDDVEGEKQFLRNLIANQLLTSVARLGFDNTSWGKRPDGGPYGFPSGHVAFAASGASFLQERYGWEYGVPAWLLTGYVAWVRVDNDNHRWRDVVASSVLAYGVAKLFVTPENATHLAPVIGPDYLGLRWERSW